MQEAGQLVLDYYRLEIGHETKDDNTPVTRADREAEELLRDRLAAAFPSHTIIGEEFGDRAGDAENRWLLDPIDGTRSFVHGVPLFGVLAGLERAGRPHLGVAAFPALGEVFWAEKGGGSYLNGEPIAISAEQNLGRCLLVTGSLHSFAETGRLDGLLKLALETCATRTWGDAFGHCMVARGKADIMLDPRVKLWDMCAVAPIVTEAGGEFIGFDGGEAYPGDAAISCTPAIAGRVVEAFKS